MKEPTAKECRCWVGYPNLANGGKCKYYRCVCHGDKKKKTVCELVPERTSLYKKGYAAGVKNAYKKILSAIKQIDGGINMDIYTDGMEEIIKTMGIANNED